MDAVAEIIETPAGGPTGSDADAWGGTSHKDGFLMSTANSADIVKRIPHELKTWDAHTSPSKAFNLSGTNNASSSDTEINNEGSIKVELSLIHI